MAANRFDMTLWSAVDVNGVPLSGATLTFYASGTTTLLDTYSDSGLVTANTNPVVADANGRFGDIFLQAKTYKVVLKTSSGTTITTMDPVYGVNGGVARTVTGVSNIAALQALVKATLSDDQQVSVGGYTTIGDGGGGKFRWSTSSTATADSGIIFESGEAGTGRWLREVLPDYIDLTWFNIASDGSTDDTATITTFFTAYSAFRGTVRIPYNTKFTKSTVYAAVPVGVTLIDESGINTGQPPSYKNKSVVTYTNDTAADDAYQGINSAHHPALRLNNLHTAATSSATNSYHSILFSHGYRWNNDNIDGMQYQTRLSPRGSAGSEIWRNSWVTLTKAQAAVNCSHWTASTVYSVGDFIDTTDGEVWKCTTAGTSSATEPTGTGPTFSDGTVTWTWQYAWSVSSTLFYFDEDGYGGYGNGSTTRFGVETTTRKGLSINAEETSKDVYLRDDQRDQDLLRLSDTYGLQTGALRSLARGSALTGATPSITSELHAVTNGSATNMTNLVLPTSQTYGYVTLYFTNGNTTVKASGFNLKGGVDVTPAAGNVMVFMKDPTLSSNWTEVSRNF